MADINLLPAEERASERLEVYSKRMQFTSIGFLVVVGILTVITLIIFAAFSSQKANLVASLEDYSGRINALKANEELIVVVKDKVSSSARILEERVNFPDTFSKLATLVPHGVFFTDVRVADGKTIISGKARSSADVAALVSSLISTKGAEIFKDVMLDNLSSDEAGIFSFVISAKLAGSSL